MTRRTSRPGSHDPKQKAEIRWRLLPPDSGPAGPAAPQAPSPDPPARTDPEPVQARTAPRTRTGRTGTGGGDGDRQSPASRLVELARDRFDLVMSEDGRPYGIARRGPNIALPLRGSRGLRTRLAALYADATRGTAPAQSALADALAVLEGYAARTDPVPVCLRLARHGETIVVDLGTADGRCVVVGPGGWHLAGRSPVLFRRTALTSPLPDPVRDGDGLAALAGLLNADPDAVRLLAAWMVSALVPDIPHPILAFKGEQGTGKTTAARAVVQLLDPSPAPLRAAPRDARQWAVTAAASWAVCLDNVSAIPGWLSEALCRAVTGDGAVDRALYTDDDVTVLAFRRVVMMTSIDAGDLAGDLAERLVLIELAPLAEGARRTDAELSDAYGQARPAILAALLDLAADVLKHLPGVRPPALPRMADFARILAAADAARGWDTLTAYTAAADTIAADVLDGDPFGRATAALVRAQPGQAWTGTAAQLLAALTPAGPAPKNWPRTTARAGAAIARAAPLLRKAGITCDNSTREPQGNRSRLYTLTATAHPAPPESTRNLPPAPPAPPGTPSDQPGHAGGSAGGTNRQPPAPPAPGRRAGGTGGPAGGPPAVPPAHRTPPDQHEQPRPGGAGGTGGTSQPLSPDTSHHTTAEHDAPAELDADALFDAAEDVIAAAHPSTAGGADLPDTLTNAVHGLAETFDNATGAGPHDELADAARLVLAAAAGIQADPCTHAALTALQHALPQHPHRHEGGTPA